MATKNFDIFDLELIFPKICLVVNIRQNAPRKEIFLDSEIVEMGLKEGDKKSAKVPVIIEKVINEIVSVSMN